MPSVFSQEILGAVRASYHLAAQFVKNRLTMEDSVLSALLIA
jgi:hypothetical protein